MGYEDELDPNWEYQGRSRRQVAGSQETNTIFGLAILCAAMLVFAYFAAKYYLGGKLG